MKKIGLLISVGFILSILMSYSLYKPDTDGSPAGQTGSPHDDSDCSSCHSAKPKNVEGLIISNVANEGYTPGKKYTITANLKGNQNSKKFGFQISPQNNKGKVLGKMVVTNPLETRIIENGKYINQIKAGVDSNGSRTWSFEWIAPAKGSGDVTFYGSFLIGGKPEIVYNSKLLIKEKK